MAKLKVDIPSLFMVSSFTANIFVSFYYPTGLLFPRFFGEALLVFGILFFVYVLSYLRSGFFGETEPKLDHLIADGPYRFCRHPQYLSFIIIILAIDWMLRSVNGFIFTFILSIPSAIYRGRIEDRLLRTKFGEGWVKYAENVGFFFPKLKRSL